MARWIIHLLCKPKDLSLDPQCPHKASVCVIPALLERGKADPSMHHTVLTGLTLQNKNPNWRELTDQSSWKGQGETSHGNDQILLFPCWNILAPSHQRQANCRSQSGVGLSGTNSLPQKNWQELAGQLVHSTAMRPCLTEWKSRTKTVSDLHHEPCCAHKHFVRVNLCRSKTESPKDTLKSKFS